MLNFTRIELGDKALFEKYTKCHGYHNLEASFANIFIWSRAWNIRMATDEVAMYLHLDNGELSFMLPPFLDDCDISMEEPLCRCEELFESRGEKTLIKGVTTPVREKIERDCPGRYTMTADRANFEYVYHAKDLCSLEGKKYHAKRNHINRLLGAHQCEYRQFTPEDDPACMALYDSWVAGKGGLTEGYQNELWATRAALDNLAALELKCGVLLVDGRLEAFSIGEKFDDDMAIIHIEKANADIQGTYALINREFVCHEWNDVAYINREEDMGIEGLRKAKQSYYPAFLNEKFVCTRNE